MTTCADFRSIFDLGPNDEALIGLREVNPVLQQTADAEPASCGMNCSCSFMPVLKTVLIIFDLFETWFSTQG